MHHSPLHRSLFLLAILSPTLALAAASPFPKLYVFGDSLSDTGNIYNDTENRPGFEQRPKAPFYTTGRFTNGTDITGLNTGPVKTLKTKFDGVWHEKLSSKLGIDAASASTSSGDNYSYGGAQTGTGTSNLGFSPNVRKQVTNFFARYDSIASGDGLYIVWGGGNDIVNAATALFARPADVKTAGTTAISNLKTAITELYNAGARHFLWPNLPPLEKTPVIAALNKPSSLTLFNATRDASATFRTDLTTAITALKTGLPEIDIRPLDIFGLFGTLLASPGDYNITNTTDPVINTVQSLTVTGTQTPGSVGKNPDDYVFWDQIHPTTHIHSLIGEAAYIAVIPDPATSSLLLLTTPLLLRRRRAA